LWALAGVILFYVALREQRIDIQTNRKTLETQVEALEQQIKEFELQRRELKLTREVFIEQNNTLKKQQFESTYFNTLNVFIEIVQNITFYNNNGMESIREFVTPGYKSNQPQFYKGRDCFEFYFNSLERRYHEKIKNYVEKELKREVKELEEIDIPTEKQLELLKDTYCLFFDSFQSNLGHYFRTLYNLIRFVNDKANDNPKYYTNLVRSQLSTYEHIMLFYNGVSVYGEDKFKPLIEKYSLLNNMPRDLLLDKKHIEFYEKHAYE